MEKQVVHTDPQILGGTPVFVGTRVPPQALFDYLESGHSLDEFLDDFPSVPRELAIATLIQTSDLVGQHGAETFNRGGSITSNG